MKVVLSPIEFWFHDLCSCLQDCIATILLYHKHNPTLTMGASWEFYHAPSEVRREEFYHPLPRPTLAESMMPFLPIRSSWHQSEDGYMELEQIKALLVRQQPVIVAVDNFYVPFRPAFGDVHAAHLLVMFGFDEEHDTVYVLDSTPPTYSGPIPTADFLRARGSANPISGEQYVFFAGSPIANRWLQLDIDRSFPELTRQWTTEVIATNVRRFRTPEEGPGWSGMAGLARYLHTICERAARPDGGHALQELYTVGWVTQAATALHADFLAAAGRALDWDGLVEVGRHVDRLAHEWTALRMFGAHGFTRPAEVVDRLERRVVQFLADQEQTLNLLEWAIA